MLKLASADSIESISPEKKLCGVLWQTATMHCNFKLYGGYIGMDMMKRGINTLLWPYFAVAMYDKMKKLCTGCKGLLCDERDNMYQFAADFLAEFSPERPLASVDIVAGDGYFSQDFIFRLGFTEARFVLNMWHLLDSSLEKNIWQIWFYETQNSLGKICAVFF